MFLCNFTKDKGSFLFWKWELWQVGGAPEHQPIIYENMLKTAKV